MPLFGGFEESGKICWNWLDDQKRFVVVAEEEALLLLPRGDFIRKFYPKKRWAIKRRPKQGPGLPWICLERLKP